MLLTCIVDQDGRATLEKRFSAIAVGSPVDRRDDHPVDVAEHDRGVAVPGCVVLSTELFTVVRIGMAERRPVPDHRSPVVSLLGSEHRQALATQQFRLLAVDFEVVEIISGDGTADVEQRPSPFPDLPIPYIGVDVGQELVIEVSPHDLDEDLGVPIPLGLGISPGVELHDLAEVTAHICDVAGTIEQILAGAYHHSPRSS